MASIQESLSALMSIDGALCAAVVDSGSGMLLGSIGSGVDLELAAAGNTEVVRAKPMKSLNLNDRIDDILITLGKQYHVIRPLQQHDGLFIYLVLDKEKSNLALARRKVQDVEQKLAV